MRLLSLVFFSGVFALLCRTYIIRTHPLLGTVLTGKSSFYGPGFHGRLTANGEKYDQNAMTCASKELPFNTMLEVQNLNNGKTIIVRVNDRGPFVKERIIDLSVAAAKSIAMVDDGVIEIEATVVGEEGKVFIKPTRPIVKLSDTERIE